MAIASLYHAYTERVLAWSGGSDTTLHLHFGLAIWLVALLVLRRPSGPLIALLAVAMLELFNETMDRLHIGNWDWPNTKHDMLATMVWPTLLTIALLIRDRTTSARKS